MTIMNHSGLSLGTFFRHSLDQGEALVLATVVQTVGSTYRKAGAQMLIAHDGRAAGLLSGGCLEADLMERARAVLDTGTPMLVEYDTRGSDDVLWGIGLGCEGAMTIVMQRLDRANDYQPYRFVDRCRQDHQPGRFALVASASPGLALGAAFWTGGPAAPSIVAAALDSPTAGTTTTLDVDETGRLGPPRLGFLGDGRLVVVSHDDGEIRRLQGPDTSSPLHRRDSELNRPDSTHPPLRAMRPYGQDGAIQVRPCVHPARRW